MRRGGMFNLKIDYEDENIVRRKTNKIKEVKKIVEDLELKFR